MIQLTVLLGVLGAAVLGFVGFGLRDHFRTVAMARRAHESGMHFSADDTFDVPRRCAAFALCSAGHSAQASNITYGHLRSMPVRAFDFRYEVGHGTRRSTRYYCVVLVEAPFSPSVLMWNRRDAAGAPPAARLPDGQLPDWSFRGDAGAAGRIGDLCAALAPSGASIEARSEGLMLCYPAQRRKAGYELWLDAMPGLVEALWPAAPKIAADSSGGI